MGRRKPSKYTPSTDDYLEALVSRMVDRPRARARQVGLGVGAVATALVAALTMATAPLLWTLGALAVGVLAFLLAERASLGRARAQMLQTSPTVLEAAERAVPLRTLSQRGRLHKHLDGVALELLEAGAFHYARLRTTLGSAAWSSPDLAAHWRSVRSQAREAADQAMAELLLLVIDCVRPQKRRGGASKLKDVFEDLIDLDIEDALEGLRDLAKERIATDRYQSERTPMIVQPARHLAERLKLLADEIGDAKTIDGPGGVGAGDSIDVVLGELKAVRKAESELSNRLHLEE